LLGKIIFIFSILQKSDSIFKEFFCLVEKKKKNLQICQAVWDSSYSLLLSQKSTKAAALVALVVMTPLSLHTYFALTLHLKMKVHEYNNTLLKNISPHCVPLLCSIHDS
jgi:hypothetical protein